MALLVVAAGATSIGDWQNLGPGGGGGLRYLAVDPLDPPEPFGNSGTLFVGCDVYGIFKSTNNGWDWEPALGSLADQGWLHSIGEISPSPHTQTGSASQGCILAHGGGAYLYSPNSGVDWQLVPIPTGYPTNWIGAYCFAWHPAESNRVLMGRGTFEGNVPIGGLQVLHSDNSGQSITEAYSISGNTACSVFSLATDPRAPANAAYNNYVYASTTIGIYLSTDFGQTWSPMPQPMFSERNDPVPPERLRVLSAGLKDGSLGYLYLTVSRGDNPAPEGDWPGPDNYDSYARIFRYDLQSSAWAEIAKLSVDPYVNNPNTVHFLHVACVKDDPDKVLAGLIGWLPPDRNVLYRCTSGTSMSPGWEGIVSAQSIAESGPQLHWGSAAFGLCCNHLALCTDATGYSWAYFGGNTSYMYSFGWEPQGSDIFEVPVGCLEWFDLSSERIGDTRWRGRGLTPTCIGTVACRDGVVWAGDWDSRVWRSVGSVYDNVWMAVNDPLVPGSNFYQPDWGYGNRGDGCAAVAFDPFSGAVYAGASTLPAATWYSGFAVIDGRDHDGAGAVLSTSSANSETNSGWSDYCNSNAAFNSVDTTGDGRAPRIYVDQRTGDMHVAAHGSGYFHKPRRGSSFSQEFPNNQFRGYCFAARGYQYSTPSQRGDSRVVVGCGSYNDRWSWHGGAIRTGGLWYRPTPRSAFRQPSVWADTTSVVVDYLDVLCLEDIPNVAGTATEYLLAGCWDQNRHTRWDADYWKDYCGVFRSEDGGQTWSQARCYPPGGQGLTGFYARRVVAIKRRPGGSRLEVFAAVSHPDGGQRVPASPYFADAGIWRSTDGGATWSKCDTPGLGMLVIDSMDFLDANTLVIGTAGCGLWVGSISEMVHGPLASSSPWAEADGWPLRVVPVRTVGSFHTFQVMVDGRRSMPVRLAVYQLDGRLVEVLADYPLGPGRHDFRWPASSSTGVPSGVYVWQVRAPGTEQSGTVIHLR